MKPLPLQKDLQPYGEHQVRGESAIWRQKEGTGLTQAQTAWIGKREDISKKQSLHNLSHPLRFIFSNTGKPEFGAQASHIFAVGETLVRATKSTGRDVEFTMFF